jgi:hypothetical protein
MADLDGEADRELIGSLTKFDGRAGASWREVALCQSFRRSRARIPSARVHWRAGPRPRPLRRDADCLTARRRDPRARALASIAPVIGVGIGVAWTLVLAIGVWIVKRAISRFGHHLLRRSLREAYREQHCRRAELLEEDGHMLLPSRKTGRAKNNTRGWRHPLGAISPPRSVGRPGGEPKKF